jgi:homoserine dehydrogenase
MASPLKIGIAGLGTVGASVVRLIDGQRDALVARCGRPIEVVAVSARSRGKKRDLGRKSPRWVADPVALATDPEIDVFVELMGGEGDPARAAVSTALAAKKSVVTANKALLARHGVGLAAVAEKNHVALNFEAAVGGAIPIVKTLREGLAGNSLARIYGILNGTCNYILTRMEQEKLAFADCLKEAQRLGYAEADPTFDIEGHDTAQKLAILASPREAARGRGADGQGYRAARASDHGAERHRDRAGDGRHQRRDRRCRCDHADHVGRPGCRRNGDGVFGRFRYR